MEAGRNFVLIGFMGTGKTSVGKSLAKKLNRELLDVDHLVEEKEKRRIREIFEKDGEAHFRRLEKEMIREVSKRKNAVITTGGGAVLDSENMALLKENGFLICLSASPETIFKRVQHSEKRPLLQGGDKLAEIKRLLSVREPFYRVADKTIETDGQTPEETALHILKLLEERAA